MAKRIKQLSGSHEEAMRSRLTVISVLFILYGAGLVARLFYLQVLQHDELVARSAKQYLKTANIFYGRGLIFASKRAGSFDLYSLALSSGKSAKPTRLTRSRRHDRQR